ncbi:MAG: TatD family hydrolase [Planctomycetales bacterium]|nr:TatD family hydrolase [Planctomycetales bacterium]
MELFDTHAHLDDEQLCDQLDEVIARAREANVTRILAVGTTRSSSERCVEIAGRYPEVFAAVGIQPNYCHEVVDGDWERIVELANAPKVVALGETGLDKYWDYCPWDVQVDFFRRHISLAAERQLPFIVHMRECESEMLETLQAARTQWGALSGVMHSFTGNLETAESCIEMGLYISFAGMITYKNASGLRSVAEEIPEDRLLIETDAPYLSPVPVRDRRPNEPAHLLHTARALAVTCRLTLEELAEATTANARRLFLRER